MLRILNTRLLLFGLPFLLFSHAARAGEQPATSVFTHVKVFLSNAQVTRQAHVNVNAGTTQLVFSEVSPYLNANSIQVKTSEHLELVSVATRNNYLRENKLPEEMEVLQDSLEHLAEQLAHLKSK